MVHDSISPNLHWEIPDTVSFFKGFIQCQDELILAPAIKRPSAIEFRTISDSASPIHQQKISDSQQCTSVFIPHQLTPRGKEAYSSPTADPGWILGIFLFCLLLLAFVKISFPRRLNHMFRAFVSPRGLSILTKEGNILTERITPPLTLLSFMAYALFFYRWVVSESGQNLPLNDQYLLYTVLLGLVAGIYGLRIVCVRLIAWVFITPEQSRMYLTNVFVIQSVWAIALIPLTILMFYLKSFASNYLLISTEAIFILVVLYMLIRSFMIGMSVTKFSWLYLFLYLCTVEILPLIILGKFANEVLLGLKL